MARKTTEKETDEVKETSNEGRLGKWIGLVNATGSPLKLFALIVLICNSGFGIAAAWAYNSDVFIYTLHTFLFVVAAFVLIALWSPRSFYPPSELAVLRELELRHPQEKPDLPPHQPIVPSIILGAFVLLYGVYQFLTST